jgi:phosphatidylglycerophosphate synthase
MGALPNLLSLLRLILVPALLALAWCGLSRTFAGCLIASLVSDGVDGYVARRFNATSRLGAKLDSWADFTTYLTLPLCGWWLRPEALRAEAPFLAVLVCGYLAAVGFGFWKYRRLTSYHTRASRAAAVLAAVVVVWFFLGGPGWAVRVLTPVAVLSLLEEIAITAVLPEWRANVPSLWHARRTKASAK